MSETTRLSTADGHQLDAYLAMPSGAPRGALVIIQEIFGMNGHMRQVCDQYAADGYACIGPALFDRVEKGIELGYGTDDQQQGMATRQKLEWDAVLKDVDAAHAAVSRFGNTMKRGKLMSKVPAPCFFGAFQGCFRNSARVPFLCVSLH